MPWGQVELIGFRRGYVQAFPFSVDMVEGAVGGPPSPGDSGASGPRLAPGWPSPTDLAGGWRPGG